MVQLVNRSQEAIQALHECIWEVVRQVMESAGKSAADGLGVALHLVGMLPTIPLQLTFNTWSQLGHSGILPRPLCMHPKVASTMG